MFLCKNEISSEYHYFRNKMSVFAGEKLATETPGICRLLLLLDIALWLIVWWLYG